MKPSLKKDPVKYWLYKIEQEKEAHKDFRKEAERSANAARDDDTKKHQFNVHWANTRIVRSAVYAKRPKSDIRRRFQKPDPNEKELARLVERALEYSMDTGDFESPSHMVVKDFVECALGVPRIVYEVETAPIELPAEIQALADMPPEEVEALLGEAAPQALALLENPPEEIARQDLSIEHIPWNCFGWEPGHSEWKTVGWVYFKQYLSRSEVKEKYGVSLKASTDDEGKRNSEKYRDEVLVYEIWHKPTRKVYVIADGHAEPLEAYDDELNLQGFFPIPRPAFDNLKSDELIPKPDYMFIEPQVIELNRLVQRRANLVKQIKAVRVFDASIGELLQAVESSDDAVSVPVANMMEKLQGGRFENVVAELPMGDRIQVVRELDVQIQSVKDQIYETTGIADIVRGSSSPSETATAQSIKGQWANVRLNSKTSEVNRLWRDTLRIMAEILCEHFEPMQLQLMTGIEVTPEMVEMMQSDIGRSFAIDIETDSTIVSDDQEERAQKLELVGNILEKMQYTIPMIQAGQIPVEFAVELISFSIQNYKGAKQLEDAIQGLGPHLAQLQQFEQQMQQMQQQLEQSMGENQQLGMQLQDAQGQLAQVNEREEARKDAEVQIKGQEAQRKAQNEAQKLGIDGMDKSAEAKLDEAKTLEIISRMQQPPLVM